MQSARLYELGQEALAFDIDMVWDDSMMEFDVSMKTILELTSKGLPVTVRRIQLSAPVRIIVPLTPREPGWGALLVSLTAPPVIAMDVRVAGGEITRVPWLKKTIERMLQTAIAETLIWPRRVVVPAQIPALQSPGSVFSSAELESLLSDDPLLRAEKALAEQPVMLRKELERQNMTSSIEPSVRVKVKSGAEGHKKEMTAFAWGRFKLARSVIFEITAGSGI
eukprot:CAMPEP_0185752126 /NCGR_PEP_ID=MMETSP1174-20130828/10922_1 /TAXON_ID=35687 /ORGANISM="Dictyocha speculum, Strain CCMP1381" /LENGTH=222 /DNA_ID=CAMNT_0028429427 /DNA_START=1 /DNA_END=668 /DNA_ORIENTATION=-